MSIERKIEQGNVAVFTVSGQLGFNEYQKIQNEMGQMAQKLGEVSVLVLLTDFAGWEPVRDWEDTSATEHIDPYIKKMAIVGDEKWRDLVEVFTLKGLRPVPIEYFETSQEKTARKWLVSD